MTPSPGHLPDALSRRYLLGFDTEECAQRRSDVLVIGSGIAGLVAALETSGGRSVSLITKSPLTETNTWYAQGGIAGAVGEADSIELHLADTLVVGADLCDEEAVRAVVGEAPEALVALQAAGMRFDLAEGGQIALAREGGHSLPRVLHSGDATGAAVQGALTRALRASENIDAFERRFLVDLLTDEGRCVGALAIDVETGEREVFWADAVVLATGGAGQVYRVTTNPRVATGDGLAAAWRAGAEVADLEFVQFHPTALDHEAAPRFLITEALRGEGAYLLDCDEERFMLGVHPLAELAPRDIVSRESERVMKRCGRSNVWLDARHLGEEYLKSRFPTIWEACSVAGYDLSHDLLPVAPAAHYMVGGVRIDVDGRTSVPGLYASGEVASSGLHGANRLASNSLLEGLVFSRRIARVLDADSGSVSMPARILVPAEGHEMEPCAIVDAPARLRETMQRYVGMSRTNDDLSEAARGLARLSCLLDANSASQADLELANLITVGTLITHAAWLRTESRGCHSRLDFPDGNDAHWRVRTVFHRGFAPSRTSIAGVMYAPPAVDRPQTAQSAPQAAEVAAPPLPDVTDIVALALAEDLGVEPSRLAPHGGGSPGLLERDVTSAGAIDPSARFAGHIVCREDAVVAGLPVVAAVFDALSAAAGLAEAVTVLPLVAEGDHVHAGVAVARIEGVAAAVLAGERTALDFLMLLSGIATETARWVEIAGSDLAVCDTRKTSPGLRALSKYAVAVGGGVNHRQGLHDMVLVKDNHIAAAGGITAAVAGARAANPELLLEVEVDNPAQAREAVDAGADIVLLDNMDDAMLARAVSTVREAATATGRRVLTEASGGVTRDRLGMLLATGADRVSTSALTMGVRAVDFGLDEG